MNSDIAAPAILHLPVLVLAPDAAMDRLIEAELNGAGEGSRRAPGRFASGRPERGTSAVER